MRTTLLVLLVASCSSTPAPTRPPNAAAPAPRVAVTVAISPGDAAPADAAPATPHRCVRSVFPYYDPDADPAADAPPEDGPEDEPAETTAVPDGVDQGDLMTERGFTLDDKLAAINRKRPDAGVCDTRHRDALEAELLKVPTPAPVTAGVRAWDGKRALRFHDLVTKSLALTAAEQQRLARDGVVVPARLGYADFTTAYYDIHRSQLPVYVSVDSILHTVFASHDILVAQLEQNSLIERLDAALGAMHCGLATAAAEYPPEVAADLDLYLTVARSLLARAEVPGELGDATTQAAAPLLRIIEEAGPVETIMLFGRERAFDASQFTPRGHYTADTGLEAYFRAAMWLSRVEMNLVSRDSRSSQPGYAPDPTETPREAVVALALADLAERSGALTDLDALDRAWGAFAGAREDISLRQLLALRKAAGIGRLTERDVPARLRAAVGDGYQRTVNVHPMPNVPRLPAIATVLGPRITSDTRALAARSDDALPPVQGVELGYVLGHDRALAYVPQDPLLRRRLKATRDALAAAPAGDDLYASWLAAIRGLADRPRGALPSFMDRPAFADLRLDSALVAYGQLRHNHVLLAAQYYDQGGCEIPDGYVEPAPATYHALAAYAAKGRAVFAALDPRDASKGGAYYTRLERLMRVLEALSREELANRPLSASARRFLATIVERRIAMASGYMDTFPVATFDGWYLDLYPNVDTALRDAAFVADIATFDKNGQRGIRYLGAKGPRLGVFVIDTGGASRVMVGPVATGFQHTGPLDTRLTDDEATGIAGDAPWAASYTAAAPVAPRLTLEFHRADKAGAARRGRGRGRGAAPDAAPPDTVRIEAPEAIGELELELLDHHFVAMRTMKVTVGAGRTDVRAPQTAHPIEAIRIRRGTFPTRVVLGLGGDGHVELGAPSP